MKTLAKRCKHEFESGDRNRGWSYFYDGSVLIETIGEDFLLASVAGSYDQDYEINLRWRDTAESGELGVFCSCPRFTDGWLCKHLWGYPARDGRQGALSSGVRTRPIEYLLR